MLDRILKSLIAILAKKIKNTDSQVSSLRLDIAELAKKYDAMRVELAAVSAKDTGSLDLGYFVRVRLPAPMVDADGVLLYGQIEGSPYGYTLECKGRDGLNVMQSASFYLEDIDNIPYIELAVRGEGTLTIDITQTIALNGNTTIMISRLCNVPIDKSCTDYMVNGISSYPIQRLLEYARLHQPVIDTSN